MAYVYRHIRLDNNEVFYIGIGVRAKHRRSRTIVRRNPHWKNIVAKSEWRAEILIDNISFEEAKLEEISLIKQYGRADLGLGTLVNMTDGGDGTHGVIVPKEMRLEMSKRNLGKVLSEEHKQKISKALKGKIISATTRQKQRMAKVGVKQNKEAIEKRRIKLIGNKSRTGMKASPELKEKQKKAQMARREREKIQKIPTL
jgi:hypothetical protein